MARDFVVDNCRYVAFRSCLLLLLVRSYFVVRLHAVVTLVNLLEDVLNADDQSTVFEVDVRIVLE